jgi:hypothetical protein
MGKRRMEGPKENLKKKIKASLKNRLIHDHYSTGKLQNTLIK